VTDCIDQNSDRYQKINMVPDVPDGRTDTEDDDWYEGGNGEDFTNVLSDYFLSSCTGVGLDFSYGVGSTHAWFRKFTDIYGKSIVVSGEACYVFCLGGSWISCQQSNGQYESCGGGVEFGLGMGGDVSVDWCETVGLLRHNGLMKEKTESLRRRSCFPTDSTVQTPSGYKYMGELVVGDKVLAVDHGGGFVFDEVYFFGHADHHREEDYISLFVGANKTPIMMSQSHFIPTCKRDPCLWEDRLEAYAGKVEVGDRIWVNSPAGLEVKPVVKVARVVERGAFNPYTLSGSIVVDGVVASVHSEWILDALIPETWQQWLPALYQGVFFPGRVLYGIVGSPAADALDMNSPQRSPTGHGAKFLSAVGFVLIVGLMVAWCVLLDSIQLKKPENADEKPMFK